MANVRKLTFESYMYKKNLDVGFYSAIHAIFGYLKLSLVSLNFIENTCNYCNNLGTVQPQLSRSHLSGTLIIWTSLRPLPCACAEGVVNIFL